jgi:ABC-type cobalt transport system substrate-binding protein
MTKSYKMKTTKVIILFAVLIITASFKTETINPESTEYPKPNGVENMLFYVQRTINSNTIVYTLNQDNKFSHSKIVWH